MSEYYDEFKAKNNQKYTTKAVEKALKHHFEYYRGVEEIIKGNVAERNSAINDFLEGSLASVTLYVCSAQIAKKSLIKYKIKARISIRALLLLRNYFFEMNLTYFIRNGA